MFHLRFGLSDHLKALLDFVFGSRRRVKKVRIFRAWFSQEWVTQSEGAIQSKSVTSCAGMTAHFVLLAQTKVGFLSGGRSRRMKELPEKEVLAQLEEAHARATVALTRA